MNIAIPKVELHVHLDGSVRIETLSELAEISLEEAQQQAVAPYQCENLTEYLTHFSLPCSVMQTKGNLTRIARELAEDLKKENVIYAEIRFSPLAHTKAGLPLEEVINSVLEGLKQVDLQTNLILCMMRNESIENNAEIISLAKKYFNKGVVALDLAGDESQYPTSLFSPLFTLATELGIPYTIHAGESSGSESIKSAIEMGASRIGHGIHAMEDEEVMNMLKEKKILLEMCPTSNIQTKAIQNIKEHPLWNFYKRGIPVCINTDNRTVSFTNLETEYRLLATSFFIPLQDFCRMNQLALESSFLDNNEKDRLSKEIEKYLEQFSE